MGVWCDFDRNQRVEKTGAIHASNITAAQGFHGTTAMGRCVEDYSRLTLAG
jgi:hypothetical protein